MNIQHDEKVDQQVEAHEKVGYQCNLSNPSLAIGSRWGYYNSVFRYPSAPLDKAVLPSLDLAEAGDSRD